MDALNVARDTPASGDVQALLLRHLDVMRASSPEEGCHVMGPDTLLEKGAVLYAARDGDELLGVGALAQIDVGHGELKSMHTAANARRRSSDPDGPAGSRARA